MQFKESGTSDSLSARLVVAADGRNSAARKWAGFGATYQSHPFLFAGVLLSERFFGEPVQVAQAG